MKLKTFLFQSDEFSRMPYGYSASQAKMLIYADVVINGHEVIKHPDGKLGEVTGEQLAAMKQDWKGLVVTAPSL